MLSSFRVGPPLSGSWISRLPARQQVAANDRLDAFRESVDETSEASMTCELVDFCRESRTILASGRPLAECLPQMADGLARLLANPCFVETAFGEGGDFEKKLLHHDSEADFHVLAHVHQGPKEGSPHSHGSSWAIYGTAKGFTGMKEWRRINPAGEEATVLRLVQHYELGAGQTRAYGPGVIHSTIHPAKAWVIRVTGTDLDRMPRYRFDRKRDRIAAAA